MRPKRDERGFILVMAMIALLAMAIFLPALVYLVQNETKWSVKEKKTTMAFHMAEQGLDRGVWKLQESDDIWNAVSTGGVVTGYNFDLVYNSTNSDGMVAGQYKILLTSGTSGTVKVQSIGRDVSTSEVRAIEAVYSKAGIFSALQSRTTLDAKPNLEVHWGPVINYGNITNVPSYDFPRKISKGFISGRDTDPTPPNGHDFFATWPTNPTYDYNSYQTRLGNAPTIRLNDYKTMAKNSSFPWPLKTANGNTTITATPPGSGYFQYNGDVGICRGDVLGADYVWSCSTCVMFIDVGSNNVDWKTSWASQLQLKAMIILGNMDMNDASTPVMPAVIPVGAQTEYRWGTAPAYWTANFAATGEGGTYDVTDARFRGYMYVSGDLNNSGGGSPAIVGILDVLGNVNVNNTRVYYDSTVSSGVLTNNAEPFQQSWREIKLDW